MKFDKICIIGVGLIGGSLASALKRSKLKIGKIVGVGRNINKLKLAKKLGVIDEFTTDFSEGVKDANVVVISTPVETIVPIFKKILPYLSPYTTVIDVGSVKLPIIKEIQKIGENKNIDFIGTHPIAGSEKSGIQYANADLFKNATCVICYNRKLSTQESYKKIKLLWESIGAKVVNLSPEKHDKILSKTSHLLHLISYSLVHYLNKNKEDTKFVGGAYRDMTRIAGSNPVLWTNICYMNKKFIKREVNRFCKKLEKLYLLLDDYKKLLNFLTAAYKLKHER